MIHMIFEILGSWENKKKYFKMSYTLIEDKKRCEALEA